MIRCFRDPDAEKLYWDVPVKRYQRIERTARRKILLLHAARRLDDLAVPPGNRLEALHGDRKGQYSIRINEQYRLCFVWKGGDAFEVEIADYH